MSWDRTIRQPGRYPLAKATIGYLHVSGTAEVVVYERTQDAGDDEMEELVSVPGSLSDSIEVGAGYITN